MNGVGHETHARTVDYFSLEYISAVTVFTIELNIVEQFTAIREKLRKDQVMLGIIQNSWCIKCKPIAL